MSQWHCTFFITFLVNLKEKSYLCKRIYQNKNMNTKKRGITVSSELQAKIKQAHKNYQQGNYVSCHTKEELHTLLNSL